MADHESIADNATRYLFGELSPAERHEFESLLNQSSELRAQIREPHLARVRNDRSCNVAHPIRRSSFS